MLYYLVLRMNDSKIKSIELEKLEKKIKTYELITTSESDLTTFITDVVNKKSTSSLCIYGMECTGKSHLAKYINTILQKKIKIININVDSIYNKYFATIPEILKELKI